MTGPCKTIGAYFRFLTLIGLLVGGALAPAIKLALPEPITCGMDCCEESGVCCCVTRFQATTDRSAHHNDASEDQDGPFALSAETLSASCPAQCAHAPGTLQAQLIVKSSLTDIPDPRRAKLLTDLQRPLHLSNRLLESAAAPRGPPRSNRHFRRPRGA